MEPKGWLLKLDPVIFVFGPKINWFVTLAADHDTLFVNSLTNVDKNWLFLTVLHCSVTRF
jgi:hypothetical protein